MLTDIPRAFVRAVASRASVTVIPATKREETRFPSAERSATLRSMRFSERAMKIVRNIRRALRRARFYTVFATATAATREAPACDNALAQARNVSLVVQ